MLAAVAVPLSLLRHAPQGAPLKPRIILAPLALALDAPVIIHDASLVVLPARQDDAATALQAGIALGQIVEAGSGDTHPARLCRLLSLCSRCSPLWRAAFHVGGLHSGRHREHVRSVAGGALQRSLRR